MKRGNSTYLFNNYKWFRLRSILLCLLLVVFLLSSTFAVFAETVSDALDGPETRAQIKARLLKQVKDGTWDPYSSDMTLDEFYALMELFEEGKLPLNSNGNSGVFSKAKAAISADAGVGDGPGIEDPVTPNEPMYIPRQYFFLVGLPDSFISEDEEVEGEEVRDKPLIYNREYDYEPYDPYTNLRYTVTTDEQTDDEIYTLNNIEYKLGEDGKLYATTIANFTQYDHVFRLLDANNNVTEQFYTRSADGFDLKLYNLYDNTQYNYDENAINRFMSVATGKIYVVVKDGGLWEYDKETNQPGNKAFDEAACDYYYIESGEHKQLYQFKDNALCDPSGSVHPFIKTLAYYYPHGYGYDNSGYLRPAKDWEGIAVGKGNQAVIVSEGVNKGNLKVSGNVDQDRFSELATFEGYYVKAVSIGGANINVLGMIQSPATGKYVYYYLSAEEQSTQVSTTTLKDGDKFIIEYTPNEHEISYQVVMSDKDAANGFSYVTNAPSNVVFYGSNSATTASWVDGIFGTTSQRPAQTTGGAYSFNVTVPYGYELQIFISVDRAIAGTFKDGSDKDITGIPYTFHADVDHTGSRAEAEKVWLTAFGNYLVDNKIITMTSFDWDTFKSYLTRTVDDSNAAFGTFGGTVEYEWASTSTLSSTFSTNVDENKKVIDATLALIAERVNDMAMHNSARTRTVVSSDGKTSIVDRSQTGFPLGKYPTYEDGIQDEGSGFKVFPDDNSPEKLTMNDTFYNHQVKASRVITAVLTELKAPEFDVRSTLKKSSGAAGRGSIASYNNAVNADADYEYHVNGGTNDPVDHSADFPNVHSADSWGWKNSTNSKDKDRIADIDKSVTMDYNPRTGTYSYSWMFQTNSGNWFLNIFEVNGIAIQAPYFPKYNWNGTYMNDPKEVADAQHPYYTETTLQDGATLRLEFLLGWNKAQRHYRVTVVGARTNVVVTGLNLMDYADGAAEFSTYNLVGVYDGVSSQTTDSIQYFSDSSVWERKAESNVTVSSDGKGINDNGDNTKYGANIRFKVADGYGNPYFIWADRWGDPINNQASVKLNTDHEIESINDRLYLSEEVAKIKYNDNGDPIEYPDTLPDGKLSSQYVYYNDIVGSDDYGFYYIKVSSPGEKSAGNKFVLLSIVARTIKYTVRYVPEYGSEDDWYGGFLIDTTTNELVIDHEKGFDGRLTTALIEAQGDDKKFELKYDKDSYPWFDHNPDICALYEMAKDSDGIVPEDIELILHQFDDNGGNFYDLLLNNKAGIASNTYGTITPQDSTGSFAFVSWVMVGEDFKPILVDGNPVYFTGGTIDFNIYSDYAVLNSAFGTNDTDVYVIRLMPVWRVISHPYYYNVVLNWIDAKGELNMTNFSNWDKVLTETLEDNVLYVYLNQDADPLKDWIATHPTYTFWDDVNNAVTAFFDDGNKDVAANSETLQKALEKYLQRDYDAEKYPNDELLLKALVNRDYTGKREDGTEVEKGEWKRNEKGEWYYTGSNGVDDFDRLGDNIFRVNEDGGTISIWMYENKGGLIFRNEVKGEAFIADEEFYYVVQNEALLTANGTEPNPNAKLNGEYKAYPQTYYNAAEGTWGFNDDKGEFRPATDNDAWLVTFENGVMTSVKKIGSDDEPTPYFKLKDGDGIALYVPEGEYTVVEVGSKSGGGYKADAKYSGQSSSTGTVKFPWKDEGTGEMWLMGNSTTYYDPKDSNVTVPQDVSQVAATVIFKLGEKEVIQTITFYNLTTALSVELSLTTDVYDMLPANATLNQKLEWENKYLIGYQVVVVFALPENATPLVKRDTDSKTRAAAPEDNYFNMNVYWEEDGETKSRSEELVFKPFTFDVDKNEYNIQPSFYSEIGENISENANLWVGVFYLQPKETAAITMQVMSDNVNYWIDESLATTTDSNNVTTISDRLDNGLFARYVGRSGTATEGNVEQTKIINFHVEPKNGFLAISVKGGQTTDSFVFKVTSHTTGETIYVTVKGSGDPNKESIVYIYAPTADYTVTLIDTWSWRYDVELIKKDYYVASSSNSATVTVSGENNTEDSAAIVYYGVNDYNDTWLGGENSGKK